jgi:hypothetical protein
MDISFKEFCMILFSNKYTEKISSIVVDLGQTLAIFIGAILY